MMNPKSELPQVQRRARRIARVLLALALWIAPVALLHLSGCRTNLPPPPPPASGGTGGGPRGGTGGSGTGGAGGTTPADAHLPDADTAPPADTGPGCGAPGQACCAGNRCTGGGCCELGICTSLGDVCRLSPGNSCFGGTCSNECGGVVNGASMKCCSMHNCTLALTVCDTTGPAVGACISCGKPGQPCCADNTGARTYCEGNLACTANKCPGAPDASPMDAPPG
jgi:hypothetical protein